MDPINPIIKPGDFQQTVLSSEPITKSKKTKRTDANDDSNANRIEAVSEAGSTAPANDIPPSGTFVPVDQEEMDRLKERVRPGSPETASTVALTSSLMNPSLTASGEIVPALVKSPYLNPPIQIEGLAPDLSTLRYFRDNIGKFEAATMAEYCLDVERRSFARSDAYIGRKIGDFFKDLMAVSPVFLKKMRTCKVVITDLHGRQDRDIGILTNTTTLFNDCRTLMDFVADASVENPASMVVHLNEDVDVAIPAIRYLETGDETYLAGKDFFALAALASKWVSPKLQAYCKKHVMDLPFTLNDQFLEMFMHLNKLQDHAMDYILLPMASKFVNLSKQEEFKAKWETVSDKVKIQIHTTHCNNLVQQAAVSRREEHQDRIEYSLQLIKYLNVLMNNQLSGDQFYVTATDVQEALRILFNASLDKKVDKNITYRLVIDLFDSLKKLNAVFRFCKDEPEIEKTLGGWCCLLCNYLQPNLPDFVMENWAMHGSALCHAVADVSPEKKDVLMVCEEFVMKALTEGIGVSHAKRMRWLLRPTTRFASDGIMTLCIYDAQTEKLTRVRIQYYEGRFSALSTDSHPGQVARGNHAFSGINSLVYALIKSIDKNITRNDVQCVTRPNTLEEREKTYCTQTYTDF